MKSKVMESRSLRVIVGPLVFGWALLWVTTDSARAEDLHPIVTVAVAPFTIDPQPFAGAPERADEEEFLKRLSEEATEQAQRSLIERHIADAATRVSSRDAADGRVVVSGTIRMPISLPPRVIGWDASRRRGHFATATVTLLDATGKVLSEQDVAVNWGDVWWFQGGKSVHNNRLGQVLEGFARRVADHAVRRLELRRLQK